MADNLLIDNRDHEHQPNKRNQQQDEEQKCQQYQNQNEEPGPCSGAERPRNGSLTENSEKLFNSPKITKGSSFGTNNDSSSNFQFQQIPISHMPRRGSRNRDPFVLGSTSFQQNRGRNTFLEKFRSQTSIPESVANSKETRNGSSQSALTSPIDLIPPPSPCSTKSSIGAHSSASTYYSGNGSRPAKPKKWFSFTNLINRQNISSLLNLPKSRLSVSSTLNSVFVGPTSPSPSGSTSCPGGGNGFFGGLNNFNGNGRQGSGLGINDPFYHPVSPTSSSTTVSGDHSNRFLFGDNSPGQVVFRRKSGGRSDRSSSATNSVVVAPGGNIVGSGNASSAKHYSSGGSSGCGNNSESTSERSSGVGYYTGYSSSSSTAGGIGFGERRSSGGGGSRLSCGEFFTGTPNSPIFSGGTPTEFQFQFHSGHSSSGFDSREEGSSYYSTAAGGAFHSYHKALGRSLPTLLGKSVFSRLNFYDHPLRIC